MSAMSSFIKCPIDTRYEGEDKDEQILYLLRRSKITNVRWIGTLFIMSVVPILIDYVLLSYLPVPFLIILNVSWYLGIFGMFLFNLFNWFFNIYIISDKKIVDFDFYGLSYKNVSETPLVNIQDTTSNINGPINMLFNIGDVLIQTAGERSEFDFESIDNPGKIRDIISDLVSNIKGGKNAQL